MGLDQAGKGNSFRERFVPSNGASTGAGRQRDRRPGEECQQIARFLFRRLQRRHKRLIFPFEPDDPNWEAKVSAAAEKAAGELRT